MPGSSFLLYGANGYTGRLIARHAAGYNLTPVLAGRSRESIVSLARDLNLPYKIIDLDDEVQLIEALKEVSVVLHAAGPFEYTARQMANACIKAGTHYLDINGDIAVFELLKKYDNAAREGGIMIMPGVGFDVVPTDCIALQLKEKLPDAFKLELAFATVGGSLSHGTATTMAGKLGEGGAIRENGNIKKVELGAKGMEINFFAGVGKKDKSLFVMNIPWGDVSTAYFTTGIPNIETYVGVSKKSWYVLKLQFLFNWLLRTEFIRNKIKSKINSLPAGPTDEQRKNATGLVWGRATNAAGTIVTAMLCGPEGYTITFHTSLLIIQKILGGNFKPGYQTPAKVYGSNLIAEVPGVELKKDQL